MIKIKSIIKHSLLLLSGLLLAIIAIEIYLRVVDNPFDFRIRGDKIALPIHQEYRIHNTEIPKLDEFIIHKKNSLGFRGVEPPDNFDDYLTLVTIGGSTTESFYISEGQTWTDLLGAKLTDNFDKLWINNAGLDGNSTFGHILLVEDYIIQLKPDIVLFLVGINDVGRDDLGHYDEDILKPETKPTDFIRDAVLNTSEFATLAYNLIWYVQNINRQMGHTDIDVEALPTVEISEAKILEIKQSHSRTLESYRLRLKKLIQIVRANDMEPIIITQPSLYGDGIDETTGVNLAMVAVRKNISGKAQWQVLEMYNDVSRAVADEEGVLVIDLAQQMPKDSRYYYDFMHYTEQGSEQIAEIIYRQLCPFLSVQYNRHLIKECGE